MTEWWLRKAVICHLSPIFCNYYFIRDGIPTSPLTRSVGSVTSPYFSPFFYLFIFQLTRSVGSVTLHIVYVKSHHHNRADILLKITLKSDIFYIICIIFSANLHINQYHCTFAHKIKLPSGSYVSFAPICSTLLFQLLPK